MIVRVDLVPVRSIAESVRGFGDRFLERLFTNDEIRYCRSRAVGAARLDLSLSHAGDYAIAVVVGGAVGGSAIDA